MGFGVAEGASAGAGAGAGAGVGVGGGEIIFFFDTFFGGGFGVGRGLYEGDGEIRLRASSMARCLRLRIACSWIS